MILCVEEEEKHIIPSKLLLFGNLCSYLGLNFFVCFVLGLFDVSSISCFFVIALLQKWNSPGNILYLDYNHFCRI